MSPESLSDGVFTNQSGFDLTLGSINSIILHLTDIRSFGVLIWEILTLGAKPYPAMGNREVMQYVRSGGRLEKPGNVKVYIE